MNDAYGRSSNYSELCIQKIWNYSEELYEEFEISESEPIVFVGRPKWVAETDEPEIDESVMLGAFA